MWALRENTVWEFGINPSVGNADSSPFREANIKITQHSEFQEVLCFYFMIIIEFLCSSPQGRILSHIRENLSVEVH